MELNLAPVTKSRGLVKAQVMKGKKNLKGSWKKRRREEIIQRIRLEKRLRGSNRQGQKEKAFKIQSDEFASGIEEPGVSSASAPAARIGEGDEDMRRKTKKGEFSLGKGDGKGRDTGTVVKRGKESVRHESHGRNKHTKSDNVVGDGGKGKRKKNESVDTSNFIVNDNEQKSEGVKRRKTRGEDINVNNYVVVSDDQKPEAVSAALAVIGKSFMDQNALKGKEYNHVNKDRANLEKNERAVADEMFGTTSFEDTGLYPSVARHLVHRMELRVPTQIQEKVLNVMLNLDEGQQAIDVLVCSATGSGKTLAYLLPIAHYLLHRVRRISREDGTLAVVVVPTRELAEQVQHVAAQVFRPWHWIVTGSVMGGESKHREKSRLRKGIGVLIATPGRLLDHMRNTRSFMYGFCEFLVLDEADRLLDLGFEAEIKEIVGNLNNQAKVSGRDSGKTRSNMLLSATLRADVEKLAEFSMQNPVKISVDKGDGKGKSSFSMPQLLRQHFCIVDQRHRLVTLICFLRLRALKDKRMVNIRARELSEPHCKVIVFFSTCDSVDFHYELLKRARVPGELKTQPAEADSQEKMVPLDIFRIHGKHEQVDRVQSLRGFRKSRRAVLLCTDVAARGLDLKGLTFSIQYDPPTGGQGEELEYLHRAGRTARIGEEGDALLFLLPSERAYIGKLESKGVSIAEISGSAAIAALYPKVDLTKQHSISYGTRLVTSALQESLEATVQNDGTLKQLAVTGFQSYCRAYATHAREVRYFFHVRNLHLGHVARAFVLGDKPAELSQMMAEIKAAKAANDAEDETNKKTRRQDSRKKGDIAQAIAEGERQPYNDQSTSLSRRRREKGGGQEAFKELAMEFGS